LERLKLWWKIGGGGPWIKKDFLGEGGASGFFKTPVDKKPHSLHLVFLAYWKAAGAGRSLIFCGHKQSGRCLLRGTPPHKLLWEDYSWEGATEERRRRTNELPPQLAERRSTAWAVGRKRGLCVYINPAKTQLDSPLGPDRVGNPSGGI